MRASKVPDVASLAWGLPSFTTPASIREAVKLGLDIDQEIGKYSLPDGLPELREAVASEHKRLTGISVDPDQNVIITAGNMQAVNAVLHTAVDPGDEVILTDPCFSSHIQQIRLCDAKPVFWPLVEQSGWTLDIDALPDFVNDRTRAIILVSPSNPTGTVFSRSDLLQIAKIVDERGLLLIIDDPYRHLVFDNETDYCNPASIAEFGDNIAYCFTFSKSFAMSGWRLGYMIVPGELKHQVLKVHDATLICAPRVAQVAALAALKGDMAFIDDFSQELSKRRALIFERLDRVRHVFEYVKPQGAYYVFPRIRIPHGSAHDFAVDLLENTGVCVTPGSAFGPSGKHHVRMAFCTSDQEINRAFDRMESRFGGPSVS